MADPASRALVNAWAVYAGSVVVHAGYGTQPVFAHGCTRPTDAGKRRVVPVHGRRYYRSLSPSEVSHPGPTYPPPICRRHSLDEQYLLHASRGRTGNCESGAAQSYRQSPSGTMLRRKYLVEYTPPTLDLYERYSLRMSLVLFDYLTRTNLSRLIAVSGGLPFSMAATASLLSVLLVHRYLE
jgi:hypothetical protein